MKVSELAKLLKELKNEVWGHAVYTGVRDWLRSYFNELSVACGSYRVTFSFVHNIIYRNLSKCFNFCVFSDYVRNYCKRPWVCVPSELTASYHLKPEGDFLYAGTYFSNVGHLSFSIRSSPPHKMEWSLIYYSPEYSVGNIVDISEDDVIESKISEAAEEYVRRAGTYAIIEDPEDTLKTIFKANIRFIKTIKEAVKVTPLCKSLHDLYP